METVIQIPLYRWPTTDNRQLQTVIPNGVFAALIVSGIVAWSYPVWGWKGCVLLGGIAGLGWWAMQYHDFFFPIPQATLAIAYRELRIVRKKDVCFFAKTDELKAFVLEEGNVPTVYISAQSSPTIRIAYMPGSKALRTFTFPSNDYLIYREQDWLQLQESLHLSSSRSTFPASTLPN